MTRYPYLKRSKRRNDPYTIQNFAGANGNTDAGIYAIGGNDTFTVSNVIIQNNVGGSGFYANGLINTVTIDSVTSSGHT
ncbi:MAG: hypothetical protein R2942_11655 [Ignavibacteria bacterium]